MLNVKIELTKCFKYKGEKNAQLPYNAKPQQMTITYNLKMK